MDPTPFLLVVLGLPAAVTLAGAVFAARVHWQRHGKRGLQQLAAERGLLFIRSGPMGVPEVTGEVEGLPVRVVPGSFDLRRRGRAWMLEVGRCRLARRTTLQVSLESGVHRVSSSLGRKDIEIGKKHFDGHFRIEGSDADVIRGVLCEGPVRAALVDLFFKSEVTRCELWEGALYVDIQPARRRTPDVTGPFDRVLALARALEEAADVAPVPEAEPAPRVPPGGSLGGGSGAPVGVPVFEES